MINLCNLGHNTLFQHKLNRDFESNKNVCVYQKISGKKFRKYQENLKLYVDAAIFPSEINFGGQKLPESRYHIDFVTGFLVFWSHCKTAKLVAVENMRAQHSLE